LEQPAHYDPRWRRWSLDTLPMVPPRFDLRVRKGVSKQWKAVRRLLRDRRFDEVVNACDAGREGELIFRNVYDLSQSRLPVRRLWLSSLTDKAIHAAWGSLLPGARFEALGDAARCRSEADWLVGLNATRAMTCAARRAGGDSLLSVGRVQTPTLAMIVARDRAIEAFVPETFWQVKATLSVEREGANPTWQAAWFQDRTPRAQAGRDEVPHAERLADVRVARGIAAAAEGQEGVVEAASRARVTQLPPLLYDLTSLQRRANQRYGFDAGKTLEIAQNLYEKHKLITYPRTDARYLTPDQVPGLPDIVRGLASVPGLAPFAAALLAAPIRPGRRVVDASEVGDHPAIIPTGRAPRRLTGDETRVFDLVARRFLAALSDDAVFEKAMLVVTVEPGDVPLPEAITAPLRFRARGRVCISEGWRAVDPPGRDREALLPRAEEGERARVEEVGPVEGRTKPPRPHNDASLLRAMETAGKALDDAELKRALRSAGLGTPATRASILKTLVERGFVERRKRALCATERGCALIDAVPVDELKSAELTGRWEARLAAMAEGGERRERFMADVVEHIHAIVEAIATAPPPLAEAVTEGPVPPLGACPVCGKPVREGRSVYSCETGRSCPFVVFKKMAGRAISRRMVTQLLGEGRSKVVKGFRSKKGKPFRAGLVIQEGGRVGFWFPDRKGSSSAPSSTASRAPKEGPATPVGQPCPVCGRGRLVRGRAAWGCDRWREGCRFTLPFEVDGRMLTDREAAARLAALPPKP
jgi:DNA topoisomerase-3